MTEPTCDICGAPLSGRPSTTTPDRAYHALCDAMTRRGYRVDRVSEHIPAAAPTGPTVVTVPGGVGLPRDLGGDGKYEDVNGNGRQDFADVVLYFNQMTWIAANVLVIGTAAYPAREGGS